MKALRPKLQNLTEDERRRIWATIFGIIGPEWMIILALAEAEECTAESAAISKTLKVDQSFVHAHGRRLEKQGHIHCNEHDGIVKLSLTTAAKEKLATLMPRETISKNAINVEASSS
jgi:MarR family transcriptional regulator, organic hydroperoxide resistance regulator